MWRSASLTRALQNPTALHHRLGLAPSSPTTSVCSQIQRSTLEKKENTMKQSPTKNKSPRTKKMCIYKYQEQVRYGGFAHAFHPRVELCCSLSSSPYSSLFRCCRPRCPPLSSRPFNTFSAAMPFSKTSLWRKQCSDERGLSVATTLAKSGANSSS